MKIERKKIDAKIERDLITGMIVSDDFLKNISSILNLENIKSKHVKIIAKWCLEYFKTYSKAPNLLIENIFESETKNLDEDTSELVSDFLSSISDEYNNDDFNQEYIFNQVEKYFKKRAVEQLINAADREVQKDNIDVAEQLIGGFKKIEKPVNSGIDILCDVNEIEDAFTKEDDVLFKLPKCLGSLIGPICREDFIGISAPMKRGKTWWLMYFAIKALFAGRKVLFISLEMPKNKMILRIYQNMLGETVEPKEILIPYFDGDRIEYKKVNKKGLNLAKSLKKAKAVKKMVRGGKLKLVCQSTRNLNVSKINTLLDNLEYYENFIPDVCILDYADILAPEPKSLKDKRHQIDDTWGAQRQTAQDRKLAWITGTQGSRATFNRDQTQEDISEDIRKLAHVTKMISLNQTKEEKKDNIMRVGVLAERFGEFHVDDEVAVLHHFGIGRAVLDSKWKKDVDF